MRILDGGRSYRNPVIHCRSQIHSRVGMPAKHTRPRETRQQENIRQGYRNHNTMLMLSDT